MDPDLNKYDLHHRVAHHPKMSDAEWEEAYRDAWQAYYTPEHIRTILRRAAANHAGPAEDHPVDAALVQAHDRRSRAFIRSKAACSA